jgi:hypothetical protein
VAGGPALASLAGLSVRLVQVGTRIDVACGSIVVDIYPIDFGSMPLHHGLSSPVSLDLQ